jgi:hypothetical protein
MQTRNKYSGLTTELQQLQPVGSHLGSHHPDAALLALVFVALCAFGEL